MRAFNVSDLREEARAALPRALFDFVDRGSEDDLGLARNRHALDAVTLRPRTMVDVSRRDLGVRLFGQNWSCPLAIAPTGVADLLWWRGELALARAAAAAGIPFTLATSSTTPVEDVARALGRGLWYQVYLWDERELSYEVIRRAGEAGAEALVVTADTAVSPNREFNLRSGFSNPLRITPRLALDFARHPAWLARVIGRYRLAGGLPRFANYPAAIRGSIASGPRRQANSATVTWDDMRRLRDRWPRTLIVKGLLTPEDAELAAEAGADGIVVSNHGARNLDAAVAPIDVLPEIVAAVGHRTTVLFDSGIRRGTDVVKALALGAKAVLIGRPTLYGLAAGGQDGAALALTILRDELSRTMGLVGATSIADLGPALVGRPRAISPARETRTEP